MDASSIAALQALAGGVLIGSASWLLLAALGRVAGVSGIAAGAMIPAKNQMGNTGEEGLWRKFFLIGLVGGGALAFGFLSPPVVSTRPLLLLIVAGVLVGVGTVVGSGCTSGHGVCGLGRRSTRSVVATLSFMGAGIATATVMQLIAGQI